MRRLLTAILLFTAPMAAFAQDDGQGGNPAPYADDQGPDQGAWHGRGRGARMAEALGLTPDQAASVKATFQSFNARRKPLQEQVRASMDVLRRAAHGDATVSSAQVDQAANQLIDLRVQLAQLHKEELAAVSPQLNPQQKAKLVLFAAHQGGAGRRWQHR